MELKEFRIGETFWSPQGEWVCLDKAVDYIVACKIFPRISIDRETALRHAMRGLIRPDALSRENQQTCSLDPKIFKGRARLIPGAVRATA